MKDLFLEKIKNREYISKFIFDGTLKEEENIIPDDFDLDGYNDEVLDREYICYKDYFENMYKGIDDNICLDKEQIKAILADENYSLIIAGAGTGKTTTMASKVKYLVDIKKVDPSRIAVMSLTKKATLELEKRIVLDFNLPVNVTTFHSLGMMYIREIFKNRKCYVVDDSIKNEIFLSYFKEKIFPYKNKVKEILEIFNEANSGMAWVFGKYFKENYDRFVSFDEYFDNYKEDMLNLVASNFTREEGMSEEEARGNSVKMEVQARLEKMLNRENIYTIKGELVKSKGEAEIANFLYQNNIEYRYEKVYKELLPDNRTYCPDFTLNLNGEEVYVEYFGLSNYKDDELSRYVKIRRIKENYHKTHHTKFIALDYAPHQDLLKMLEHELLSMGFRLERKSYEEIFKGILDSNPTSQLYKYRDFLYGIIGIIKASSDRCEYLNVVRNYFSGLSLEERKVSEKQFSYINDFYLYYQQRLFGMEDYGFDFSDMIYYANLYINNVGIDNKLNFDYLVIDEYQDISPEKYLFTKNIAGKNNAKVVAVGDDWQSIYAFTGSKIEYIYNFQRYFEGAKLLKITRTYRNSQTLIDYSGKFIMRNDSQIKKELVSDKEITNPIRFVLFDEDNEYEGLKEVILKIHREEPSHNIMVLARNNATIDACYKDPSFKDEIGTKITFVGHEDIQIDGMTIHKSKGLTSDEVILIGLNQNFPRSDTGVFWMSYLFKNKREEEAIANAEERRIFYVGLTRTKNYVYLLVNRNPRFRSPFVNEIFEITREDKIESI